MPHIILKRSDIPAGTLQVLDLDPNESQRNLIYDPPGQSKYVDPVVRALPVVGAVGPDLAVTQTVSGLEAWLMANVPDGAASMSPADAVTNADAIQALYAFGDLGTAAGALTLAAVNGALVTATPLSAGQLPALLDVLSGQTFTIPAGTLVESPAGTFSVSPAIGAAGGPFYGSIRRTYDTSSLTLSVNTGMLAGFLDTGFEYQGVGGAQGEAVVVYRFWTCGPTCRSVT